MTDKSAPSAAAPLAQAKLFAEAARRLDRPLDALPEGDPGSMLLVLWQQAASYAIAAARAREDSAQARLERAAGDAELLEAILRLLQGGSVAGPDDARPAAARAAIIARFATDLIKDLDLEQSSAAPWLQRLRRAARLLVPVTVPLLALLGVVIWMIRGPNLVDSAAFVLSSQASTCDRGECGNATFHTTSESRPWARYDFGRPRQLHSIAVENRTDCCIERAVPLLVETSDDGLKWQEQVRAERPFYVFRHPLKVKARYLRLRVGARTILHLHSVTIR